MKIRFLLTCIPILTLVGISFGQERSFANVTFKFTDLTKSIYQSELEALEKNGTLSLEELSKFAATLPIIEPILSAANIPYDFKILSLYKKHQTSLLSKSKLDSGVLWGFTEKMAEEMDLLINHQIDERKHLYIATNTATLYIQENQNIYQNWAITLFAHLADKNVLNKLDILSKWKGNYIVLDTPDYSSIIEFLAFKAHIESNFAKIGNIEHKMIYSLNTAGGKTLGDISEKFGISIREIIASNQWLLSGFIPESTRYPILLYIPISKYLELENLNPTDHNEVQGFPIITLNEKINNGRGGNFYIINGKPGIQAQMSDKSINLAYKADIKYNKFLEYNDLSSKDDVLIGNVYYLKNKRDKADLPYHIAKQNETLWEISQMYAVKLKKLMVYNRLESLTKLIPGQLIYMREKRPKNEAIQYINQNIKEKHLEISPIKALNPIIASNSNKETIIFFKTENSEIEDEIASLAASSGPSYTPPKEDFSLKAKPKFLVHEVIKGENLNTIANLYNVEIQKLYTLNNLINSKIEEGDKLIIRKN